MSTKKPTSNEVGSLLAMAGTTRLELATSGVTGLMRLPYYQGFQPLTLARESPICMLDTPFGVHFGVRIDVPSGRPHPRQIFILTNSLRQPLGPFQVMH
jgi:hypothetical protein